MMYRRAYGVDPRPLHLIVPYFTIIFLQYVKYHEPIYRTIEKFVDQTGNNDIDIAAFQASPFQRLDFKCLDLTPPG